MKALQQGPSDLNISTEAYNQLVEQITNLFKNIDIGNIFLRQMATDTFIPYLNKVLDKQIEGLQKQKEALQQINKQREYENKLIEARNKLEEAGKEKKRVWREGIGWVYEANQDAIAEAQKNLQEVENDRKVRELDLMIEQLQAEKDLVQAIQDKAAFKELKKSVDALLGGDADKYGINGLINITQGLYEGNDSIASSLSGVASELVPLNKYLEELTLKSFQVDYDTKTDSELFDILDTGSEEEKASAAETLKSRGYKISKDENLDTPEDADDYSYSVSGYNLPVTEEDYKNLSEADIQRMIIAWERATDAEEKKRIGKTLKKLGYLYDDAGKVWKQNSSLTLEADGLTLEADGKKFRVDMNYPLPEGSEIYGHIKGDFIGSHRNFWGQPKYEGKVFHRNEDGTYGPREDVTKEDMDRRGYSFASWLEHDAKEGDIVLGAYGGQEYAYVHNKTLYKMSEYALGTLGALGGMSLLNERGTEAIVTPYGTVTSLPSGTGVVPADVTKNLWALGEVAPAISRLLEPMVKKGEAAIGDSFSIQNMVINMNPDGSFDVDSFVNELKSAIALRKNS